MSRRALALSLVAMLGAATAYAHPKSETAIHVVRSAETLSLLAKRYGISVGALAETNRLARPDRLRIGQRLVIPGKLGAAPVAREPGPPPHFVLSPPGLDGRAPAFGWPVEGPVSSQFGRRRAGWHAGIDIKAEVGTPIFAAAPGRVYYSGREKRYGLVVKIQHPEGFATVYAHNLQNFVDAGDEVYQGQVIGTIGRTGRASWYHLHFEIWSDGKVYNPLSLLPPREARTEPEEDLQAEDDHDDEE